MSYLLHTLWRDIMKSVIDISKTYYRNNRPHGSNTTEIIVCKWCNKKYCVNKSYGTWRNGINIKPKNRFCCRDHAWKYYAKYSIRSPMAKGERSTSYKKIDLNEALELWRSGMLLREIASQLGIHKETLRKKLKKAGMKKVDDIEKKNNENAFIKDFSTSSVPFSRVAKKYNLSQEYAKQLLLCNGINYRKNAKQGYTYAGESDKLGKKYLLKKGFKSIICGNICLDKDRDILPYNECKDCTIKKFGKLPMMSYFDMMAYTDGKYYLVEVKSSSDTFQWNQAINILSLLQKEVNIICIRTLKEKIVDIKIFGGVNGSFTTL